MIGVRLVLMILLVVGSASIAGFPASGATPAGPPTWGNPDQPWATRAAVTPRDREIIARYRSGAYRPVFVTAFDAETFDTHWIVKSDDRADLQSCRQPANVTALGELTLKTLVATNCHARYSTGSVWSRFKQRNGYFEARLKTGGTAGLNNAFWLHTDDNLEIDVAEIRYPNDVHFTVHNWASGRDVSVGFDIKFLDDFSTGYHDFGVLWLSRRLVFAVDGEPLVAIALEGIGEAPADIRFSTALAKFAGEMTGDPVGRDMTVKSLKVYAPGN